MFTQDYEGRDCDITIMPWAGHIGREGGREGGMEGGVLMEKPVESDAQP